MTEEEKNQETETPLQVIQEALQYTKIQFLQDARSLIGVLPDYTSSMSDDELLEKRTRGNCDEGCAIALKKLLESRHLFSRMAIIAAPFSPTHPFKKSDPYFHMYFLAQDMKGNWYGASPANTQDYSDAFDTILISNSLADLMKKIEERDGGEWPDPVATEAKLAPNTFPSFNYQTKELRSPLVEIINGQTNIAEMTKYSQAY